jgi:hypothetical protein
MIDDASLLTGYLPTAIGCTSDDVRALFSCLNNQETLSMPEASTVSWFGVTKPGLLSQEMNQPVEKLPNHLTIAPVKEP